MKPKRDGSLYVRQPGIYLLSNVATGDFYIGCCSDIRSRWMGHVKAMRCRRHHSRRINELVEAHGLDSFRFLRLKMLADGEHIFSREREWVLRLRPTLNRPNAKTVPRD